MAKARGRRSSDLVLRALLAGFLAGVAAQGVFILLQLRVIGRYAAIAREFSNHPPHRFSPDELAHEYGWFYWAQNALRGNQGHPYNVFMDLRNIPSQRLDITMPVVVGIAIFAAFGAAVLCLGLSRVIRRSRGVPVALSNHALRAVIGVAIGMALPWIVFWAVVISVGAWYAGFDLNDGSRSLLDGLAPTFIQAGAGAAAWATISLAVSWAFLRAAVRRVFGGVPPPELMLCPKCRYAMPNAWPGRCPECGTAVDYRRDFVATARAAHVRQARLAAALLAGVAVVVAVGAMTSPVVRRRMALEPGAMMWIAQSGEDFTPGSSVRLSTPFGKVNLTADREKPGSDWTVRWLLEPKSNSGPAATVRGEFTVPDDPRPQASFSYHIIRGLSFGPLRFHRDQYGPELRMEMPMFDNVDY